MGRAVTGRARTGWAGSRPGDIVRLLPALIAVVFVLLQIPSAPGVFYNDSIRYGRQSLEMLGTPPDQATRQAFTALCQSQAEQGERAKELDPMRQLDPSAPAAPQAARCMADNLRTMATDPPGYNAIFASRPGLPALAAPFVGVLGLRWGMWLVSLLVTLASSLLVWVLLRLMGAAPVIAVAGEAAYLLSRAGYWSMAPLTEGTMLLTTLVTLVGAVQLLRRRIGWGSALTGLGLVTSFLAKYSQTTLMAAALAAAAAGCLLLWRRERHAGTWVLLGWSVLVGLGTSLATSALGWPGARDSAEDTFSDHFYHPLVADPWQRLAHFDLHYWTYWLQDNTAEPAMLLSLLVAIVFLLRRHGTAGAVVVAVGLTGVATVIAHPDASQLDRLMVPVWIIGAVGFPLLAAHLLERFGGSGRATAPRLGESWAVEELQPR